MPSSLLPAAAFAPAVRALFEQAGWQPGRVAAPPVALPTGFDYPAPVQALLRELGGLRVRADGPGHSTVRLSLDFTPTAAQGEDGARDMLAYFAHVLGQPLYPLGDIWHDHWLLCLDAQGGVYLAGNCLYQVGTSVAEGLGNILTGVRGTVRGIWAGTRVAAGLACANGRVLTAHGQPGPFAADGSLPPDLHPEVAAVLDSLYEQAPEACSRSHGYCPTPQLLSQALAEGITPQGGVLLSLLVRPADNPRHEYPVCACASCRVLLHYFEASDGIREPAEE